MRAFNEQRGQKKQTPEQVIELHSEGAERVAREQDELSADVQELIQSETNDKVIKFLEEAEELMAGATDKLEAKDTSGPTIAIETEIIEKIADAAKQKQQSGQGQSQSNGALMQMLQEMMQASGAKEGNDGQASDGEGEDAASKGGDGPEGDSNSANTNQNEESSGSTETRRLPKKSGSAGTTMPREFQKALDAYNKGLDSQ
jgi:hypothetical protein